MTFTHDGTFLEYADYAYNDTRKNERAVEIPLARQFIDRHGLDVELGNVLGHYGHTGHRVIDRHERGPGVENVDILRLLRAGERFGSTVAISTLEHVRWDEKPRDQQGAVDAFHGLIAASAKLLVTVPLGHHPALDLVLLRGEHGATSACTFVRDGDGWVQTPYPVWKPYGATTIWAESVWIGTWE